MPRNTINEELESYFPKTALVENSYKVIDETGDQIETWVSFVDCDCTIGSNLGSEEAQSRTEKVFHTHLVVLNGNYEVEEGMRVTVDEYIHDIVRVIHDQLKMFTMLKVVRNI